MNASGPRTHVANVPAALCVAARRWPDRGIHVYDPSGVKSFMAYPQLLDRALRVAATLERRGVPKGARLVVIAPNSFEYMAVVLGAMFASVVPVPVAPPRQSKSVSLSRYLASVNHLAERVEGRYLVTPSDDGDPLYARAQTEMMLEWVTSVSTLAAVTASPVAERPEVPDTDPDEVAYIQMSSGSTGPPKGILLTHRNILSNIQAIGERIEVTPEDVGVSWLPLHHDMGLVGVLLFAIYWGIPLVQLDPDRFLKFPHEWLWAFANHGGTLSPAPDFGFHYCTRRAKRSDLDGLDLSTWRVAINSSEPIIPNHIRAFERRFRPYGLRPNVIAPVYGLAEATLAVTFAPIHRPIRIDRVDRTQLQVHGEATPAEGGSALEFVSLGTPLSGLDVAVRGVDGEELAERRVGEIFVAGHSVMRGYIPVEPGGDEPTAAPSWLATGDLGYMADGELYFTGRRSDAIQLDERTLFPDELESLVARIEGVRPGSVAAFGVPQSAAARNRHPRIREVAERAAAEQPETVTDSTRHEQSASSGPELLIVAVEVSDGLDGDEMKGIILEVVHKHLGIVPHDVRILSPQSVPKTSSGKIRRFLCRELYLDEALDRRERQERWQAITTITDRARNFVAQFGRRLRGFFDSE